MEQWAAVFGFSLAVLVGQLCSFLSKKRWVRLLPLGLVLAMLGLCIAGYGLSGWTNWGYLILCLMLLFPLGAVAVGWIAYGCFCLLRKAAK